MKRTGLAALCAAMTLALVVPAGSAAAQVGGPEVVFSSSPASGLPGTKINVTGSGCPHAVYSSADGFVLLMQGDTAALSVGFIATPEGAFAAQLDTSDLAPGLYTTYVSCVNTKQGRAGAPYTVTPTPPGSYFPLSPARVLDTRDGTGAGGATSPIAAGTSIDVAVTGRLGVPAAGVTSVALNVVATSASGPASYLTVWPTGHARPLASNLNFAPGVSVPNLVIARVNIDGRVSLYNNAGTVHVAADIQGYFLGDASGSTYVPLSPLRVLDTRDGTGATATTPVGPAGVIELKVTDAGGVPAAGGTAVALNVTATNVSGAESFLTVWPSGTSRPLASNLNFIAGQTVPNLVIARVGDGGKVSIYNNVGTVDVVADTQGYFAAPVAAPPPPGSMYLPTSPVRILDTRGTGVPGNPNGQLGAGGTIELQVTGGIGGVPATATAVALNITTADSPGPDSFLTVWPTGSPRPWASNLNYVARQAVANLVIARIGANGKVSIYNNLGSTVVIADVQGYFTA